MKTCVRCGVEQPFANFHRYSLSADGFVYACKSCVSVAKKEQREKLKARSDEEVDAVAAVRGPRACTRCSEVKAPEEFPRDRGRADGRSQYCKPCSASKTSEYRYVISPDLYRARKKASYGRNRETVRRYRLRVNFGMTLAQYDEMLALQDGKCAICREPETATAVGKVLELAVDHDHETGEVRALLCGNCNKGLGNFRDSPELLLAAASYLQSRRLRAVQ
jgi:hypothetical protein